MAGTGLVTCNTDLTQCQSDLASCSTDPTNQDDDDDGQPNLDDQCPGSPAGVPVDLAGCAHEQFCAQFDVTDRTQKKACEAADWMNDEPLMSGKDRDCSPQRDGSGCVPISN